MDSITKRSSKESMLLIYVKSILKSLAGIIIIFVLLSVLMTFTSIPQKMLFMMVYLALIVDLMFCGMQSAYKTKKNGFFNGLVCGTLYVVFLVLMSLAIINGFKFDSKLLIKAVSGIMASGIGGMIGVNLK